MPKTHKILTEYPVFKVILHYALPAVMGLLFYGLQSVIDGIIVGRFMGTDALAGVNLIIPLYSAIAVIAIMTGVGSQATIGISLGKKNLEQAKNAITTGFVFVFAGCLLLALPAYYFADEIAAALGANALLAPYSVGYMKGLLTLSPFIGLMFYSDCMLKITGHPRYALFIMLFTIVLNTGLNFLFLTQWNVGTFGVGLSTGIAFTVGSLLGSFFLFNSKNTLSMLSGKFRFKLLKQMLYNGSSEGMAELAVGINLIIFNYTFMRYSGPDGVAAFTIIGYICFLGTTIFLGVSDGLIPIISYNYGAGKYDRIKKILKLTAKINFSIGVLIFLSLMFFADKMIELFVGPDDTAVIEMAARGASIYAFAFLLEGLNLLLSSYYTAMAKARYSFIIASLRGVVFVLAGILILPQLFGLTGIWLTVPLAEALTLLVAGYMLRKNKALLQK